LLETRSRTYEAMHARVDATRPLEEVAQEVFSLWNTPSRMYA
jgi:hypothetical protein